MTTKKAIFLAVLSLVLLFLPAISQLAQEPEDADQKKKGGFGGPDQVDKQLEDDDADKQPFLVEEIPGDR